MKHSIILLTIAALLLLSGTTLRAQSSNLMYGSTRIAQMNSMNPAFFPTNCNVYVNTLGINLNGSLPINVKDIIHDTLMPNPSTGVEQHYNYVDLNNMIDKLTQNSQINLGLNQYLLGFGFRLPSSFVSFSTQLKMSGNIGLPMEALSLLTEGNADMSGTPHTIALAGNDLIDLQAYIEMAIGYGIKIKNLTLGARLKPLIGLFNVSTDDTRVNIHTAADMSSMTADVYYHARVALPIDVTLNDSTSVGDLMSGAMNNLSSAVKNLDFGWGLDLGAKYEWKNFEFSASIIDMGYLKWHTVYDLHPRNGEEQDFVFEGVDISQALNGGEMNLDTLMSQYKEQLNELTDASITRGESYKTGLHTKFNIAGFYNFPLLGITFRAGLLMNGELTPRMAAAEGASSHILRSNISAIGSVNLYDWMEFTVSNTIVSNGYKTKAFNPGFGANFMIGRAAQFYILMDYGSFHFTKTKEFSIYMGGNLMFGRKKFLSRLNSTASLPMSGDSFLL